MRTLRNLYAFSFLYLLAGLFAASCERPEGGVSSVTRNSGEAVLTVSLTGDAAGTRTTTADGNSVGLSSVFVYSDWGVLEGYARGNAATYSIAVTPGTKTIYAVNGCRALASSLDLDDEDLDLVATPAALEAYLVAYSGVESFAEESATTHPFAFGKKVTGVTAETGTVSVPLTRGFSRVVLNAVKIIPYLADNITSGMAEFSFEGVGLRNASIGGVSTDGLGTTATYGNLLYDSVDLDVATGWTKDGDDYIYNTPHYFYSDANDLSSFTTFLTLVFDRSGTKVYYPIELPALERGKSYEISRLQISAFGMAGPETPIDLTSFSATIVVNEWVDEEIDKTLD